MIDNMLPRDLDDIYGPGAENADGEAEYDIARDSERLEWLFRKASEDFRFDIQDVLGDYEGDDDQEYYQSARKAIDDAMNMEAADFPVYTAPSSRTS